jgi:uncharacterized membrane protein YgaE (UPF0421/DUF939 family)
MLAIFLLSVCALFFIGVVATYIINKLFIRMKKDHYKYELEIKHDLEKETKKDEE